MAEFWKTWPPVRSPAGQQDECGSGAARKPGGNERQDCHSGDRGKQDYGEPLGGVTEPGPERTVKSAAPTGMPSAAPASAGNACAAAMPALTWPGVAPSTGWPVRRGTRRTQWGPREFVTRLGNLLLAL
jgi:hypothetical protein